MSINNKLITVNNLSEFYSKLKQKFVESESLSISITAITDAVNKFNEMFELDNGIIKAKKSLYSVGFISALGQDSNAGGVSGSSNVELVNSSNEHIVNIIVDDLPAVGVVKQSGYERLDNRLNIIDDYIPSGTATDNKLVNTTALNDAISNNTAKFIGTFETVANLPTTLEGLKNNDYAFVVVDGEYNRYKFNGTAWTFEFKLNNSSYTNEQWAAIESGINAELVGLIGTALQSETDPTVPDWAKAANKPSYNADEIAETTNREWVSPIEKGTWNSKYELPGDGIDDDLSDSVKASLALANTSLQSDDIADWAKASEKPSYTKAEVGLGNVGNFYAVSTEANQGLTPVQKQNARYNIGAIGEAELSGVSGRIDAIGTAIDGLTTEVDGAKNSIQTIEDGLGTAASKDVPESGNASSTQVVLGNDSRLTDTRNPKQHIHPISDVTNLETTLDTINDSLANLNSMFTLTDGVIKANYGLYTDSFISAKGLNPNSTSPVGGGSDVSWGAESDNIVPLEVEGVTKNLVLESGYEVLDGKISTKAEQEFVETGLASKQNKITEGSKLEFNLINNVPNFVKGVTSSVDGLGVSSVGVDGKVTLSLKSGRVIPTSTAITQIQTNEDAIQRLSNDKEDKTTVERLQSDFDAFVAGFNSMFQKDGDNVKVLGGLYTDSFISAKGYNENSSVPVGGSDAEWGNESEFGIDLSVNGVSHTLLLEGAYGDLQGKIGLKADESALESVQNDLQGQIDLKANTTTVNGLQTTLQAGIDTKASTSYVNTELGKKADKDSVYKKNEVYTKTEVNTEVSKKANTADVYSKTEVYTKTEIEPMLNAKVNAGDVYTTTQIDDKLDEKQNLINANNKLPYSLVSGTPDLSVKEDKTNRIINWNNAVAGKYPDALLVKNSLAQKANTTTVDALDTRVTNLEELPSRVSTLEGDCASLGSRVDLLERDITLKADITSVTQVQSNLTELSNKLDSMFEKNADGSIRVLGGLYTDSFISAKGSGGDAGVNQDVEEMVDTKIQQSEASMVEMMNSMIAAAITTALTTPV